MKNIFSRAIRTNLLMCVCAFLLLMLTGDVAQGQVGNDGFDPNPNGGIYSTLLQPDGKILLSGVFTQIGGQTRNHIARLNADGTLDTAFNPNANNNVYTVAVQSDGKIIIGGEFTQVGGQTRNHIARLNADGTLDTAFNPNVDLTVWRLIVQPDDKVLVGGSFTQIGGFTQPRLARLNADGTVDINFDIDVDVTVFSIALQPDGKILVGGYFTRVGMQPHARIARLHPSGAVESNFVASANDVIYSIAVQADGKILIGGEFTNVCGQTRNYIARLTRNGTLDTTFNPNSSHKIHSIVVQPDGKILVGGKFSQIAGQTRHYLARLEPTTGTLDSFNANISNNQLNNIVLTVSLQSDGKIIAAGAFTTVGGQSRNHIARVEVDGSLERTFAPNPGGTVVYTTALQHDGKIIIGGDITDIGLQTRNNIARFNADTTLDTGFDPNANDTVYALALQPDGKILVGGAFTSIGGQLRARIARLNADGTADTGFTLGANGIIRSFAIQPDGRIIVAGDFTQIGGNVCLRIARLNTNGTVDSSFNISANATVRSLALQSDGKILVGGDFTSLGTETRNRIGRLNADGSVDTGFTSDANDIVRAIAIQADGKILIGGDFTNADGEARGRLARLDSSTGAPDSFNPNFFVLSSDTTVGPVTINTIALQSDGKIIVGGEFSRIGTTVVNFRRVARVDPVTGIPDYNTISASLPVHSLLIQPDGKPIVAGQFGQIGNVFNDRLVTRLTNTAAFQTVSVTQTSVTWTRSGTSPDLSRVTFELSTDLVNYTPLGEGSRIPSTGNFTLTGLNLPTNQHLYIRACGFYSSRAIVESVRNAYFLIPMATNDNYSTNEDNTLTITAPGVLSNDNSPSGNVMTSSLFTLPAHGSVTLNSNGSFIYTPALNFFGTDSFTYQVYDGQAEADYASVRITVDSVNDVPIATNDAYTLSEDNILSVSPNGILANDSDMENDTLSAIVVSNPAHGTLTLNSDGGFVYRPNPNYNGSDSFTYKTNDGTDDSNVATVTLTVATVNDTLVVTKTADSNDGVCDADCSLREAVATADPGDTITFASPLFDSPQTITLSSGLQEIQISKNLAIIGKGANLLTITRNSSTPPFFRLFWIRFGANVFLSSMKITNGNVDGSFGGGVLNHSSTLTVKDCYFTGNRGALGGGISNLGGNLIILNSTISNNTSGDGGGVGSQDGTLTITNSTISGNNALGGTNGGGLWINGTTVTVTNSTISDNNPADATNAGGIYIHRGTVTARNSIIAGNRNNSTTPDVVTTVNGTFISEGYNIIGNAGAVTAFNQIGDQTGNSSAPIDPLLLPLANNGYIMPTHALQKSPVMSPAIDKGKSFGSTTDQRGSKRPFENPSVANATSGDASDIGAYEESFPLIVTKTADTNDGVCDTDCSLREAVAVVVPGASIEFASPLFDSPQTITLSDAAGFQTLVINKSMTITGKGAHLLTIRRASDAAAQFRVIEIAIGSTVNLSGMTITGGNVVGDGAGISTFGSVTTINSCHITGNTATSQGAGIRNTGGGTLTILNSTISNNTSTGSGGGGGIHNTDTLTVINSTISGNSRTGGNNNGGGVWTSNTTTITNSTITDNQAVGSTSASGVFRSGTNGTVTIRNSIIAANRNNSTTPDVVGTFVSAGYNLIGNVGSATGFTAIGDQVGTSSSFAALDPMLAPLAMNGSTVPTHALLAGSPAVDKGNSFGSTTDQRGNSRPIDFSAIANALSGDGSDIGGFELQAIPTAATVVVSGRVLTVDGNGLRNARVVITDMNGNPQIALTSAFGYYRFDEVEVGATYVISIDSKRYTFTPQFITVTEAMEDLNFTAQAQNRE